VKLRQAKTQQHQQNNQHIPLLLLLMMCCACRGLVGPIIQRFEQKGYKLVNLKLVHPTKVRGNTMNA
jgi:hypothetical protein